MINDHQHERTVPLQDYMILKRRESSFNSYFGHILQKQPQKNISPPVREKTNTRKLTCNPNIINIIHNTTDDQPQHLTRPSHNTITVDVSTTKELISKSCVNTNTASSAICHTLPGSLGPTRAITGRGDHPSRLFYAAAHEATSTRSFATSIHAT